MPLPHMAIMRGWIVDVVLALVVIAVLAVSGYYVVNSRSFQLAGRLVKRVDTTPNGSSC